ncbi:transposase [Azohydromonas lata]|uniref:Transposase n=1 Tax=Azohydromonas lata TaxID=45677 RepID=A0ABU5IK54_9BURK|nr:transposase [Azohydromonas lata]MDZ5459266.1 transposase [Azohydromonas lata]
MGTIEEKSVKRRRRYNAEFKQRVLAECAEPGVSVAGVALSHGLNANLVQTWRREAREACAPRPPSSPPLATPPSEPAFIPVALPPAPAPVASDIRIELRRGGTTVAVTWPLEAAAECATWLREILR